MNTTYFRPEDEKRSILLFSQATQITCLNKMKAKNKVVSEIPELLAPREEWSFAFEFLNSSRDHSEMNSTFYAVLKKA